MEKFNENRILVIGDCHIDDEQTLERFDVLGKFIMDEQPTHIVFIGDVLTLNCLSAWDKDKRKRMEGKRYKKEITAGNVALDKIFAPMRKYNDKCRRHKTKQYSPDIVYLEGNHEDRLNRYFDYDPTMEGMVGIERDLKLEARNIRWVPYREYHYIGGVGFTHIPFNKAKAIMGVDITRKAQGVTISSVVFGHTHEEHLSHVHVEGMTHLQDTYCCGCFLSKKEDYVHGRVTNYWRGISVLTNWKEGRFDINSHSLGRLERMYASTSGT